MTLTPIAESVVTWAIGKPLVRRIWFFGSRVRGDHRVDSDLDIAIELDPAEFTGVDESQGLATWMFEADGWREQLQAVVPFPVQVEQYIEGQTPTITDAIKLASSLIYEKVPVRNQPR